MFQQLLIALIVTLAFAAPSPPNLVYSLQSQRPPVARVSQTWKFQLFPGTFNSSSGSTISLSSTNLPSWVTFNAITATFSGMPVIGDLGSFGVTVQANASGVALGISDTFTLLVVDGVGPIVKLSIAEQIPGASSLGDGALLTPDGALRIPPHWSFSLGFQQYTFFEAGYEKVFYTAYQTGTNELMDWLIFDNNTVTFNGVAPAGTGEFSVTIYGSNYFGYGDLSQVFKLSVGFHSWELVEPLPALNTTAADVISYKIPIDSIRLDNITATVTDLSSIKVELSAFPFLSYSPSTRIISGTIPATIKPMDLPIPIIFTDLYNDTITTSTTFNVITSLFTTTTLPLLNLTSGTPFKLDLSRYTSSQQANYSIKISPVAASSWLLFNSSTLSLSGTPPNPLPSYSNVTVSLLAIDASTGVSSTAMLMIDLANPVVTPLPNAPSTGPAGLSRGAKLALAIIFGLLGLCLLLGLLYFIYKRITSEEGLLRQTRRDSSFQLFNEATIANSESKPKPILKSIMIAPKPAIPIILTNEKESGRKGISDSEKAREDAAAVVASNSDGTKPKRFDIMNFLKSNPKKRDTSMISLPISQNSLFGLGMGDSNPQLQHSITVVTDGVGDTYDPRDNDSDRAGESDLESSTWESQGSSSLFYSEGGSVDDIARRQGMGMARTRQESGMGRTRKESTPRQRPDFAPRFNEPSPLAINSNDGLTESEEEQISQGGIRLVSLNSSPSNSSGSSESQSDFTSAPRLVPFTAVNNPIQSRASTNGRPKSETLLPRPILNPRDSQIADAEERDHHRNSTLYVPPIDSEPINYIFDEEEDSVRLIAGAEKIVSSSDNHKRLLNVQKNRRTAASSVYSNNSGYGEPQRISLEVGEVFKFTAQLTSPPHVSISAPSRGIPPRATYEALLDNPLNPTQDRRNLPPWISFNPSTLELSGTPTQTGFVHIVIIERKVTAPGSPTRKAAQKKLDREPHLPGQGLARSGESEEVVGRYILEVGQDWVEEEEKMVL